MAAAGGQRLAFYVWRVGGAIALAALIYLSSRFLAPASALGKGLTLLLSAVFGIFVSIAAHQLYDVVRLLAESTLTVMRWLVGRQTKRMKWSYPDRTYVSRSTPGEWGRTRDLGAVDGLELHGTEEKMGPAEPRPERRERERLAVGVMTKQFEKSLTASSAVLFVALLVVGVYAVLTRDGGMIIVAAVTALFFLIAVLRQAILAWRTSKGYFGSSEHEVRELLVFAMTHPAPDDFFDDDGHLLPAFDLRPAEASASVIVGEALPGAV